MFYKKSKSISLSITLVSVTLLTSCNLKNEIEGKIESEIQNELENTLGTDSIEEDITKVKQSAEEIKNLLNKDSTNGELDKLKGNLKDPAIKAKDSAVSNAYNSILDKLKN